jgi:hypothetical protein
MLLGRTEIRQSSVAVGPSQVPPPKAGAKRVSRVPDGVMVQPVFAASCGIQPDRLLSALCTEIGTVSAEQVCKTHGAFRRAVAW